MGKKIVILGAGFGGLHTALTLGKKIGKENEIILIDKNPYHTYTPTLYEVATTSKETASLIDLKSIVTIPIHKTVNGRNINFINAEIKELDLLGGDVHLADGQKIAWDYLVLALGAETNYFDIPGLKENSFDLKSFTEALQIRDKILDLVLDGKVQIKIVIGGGGPTGVELAGELEEWFGQLKDDYGKCYATITIVDSNPIILNNLDKRVAILAQKRLKKLGVEIINNEIITKVSNEEIVMKSGNKLAFDILIWAGGVKANSLVSNLPLKMEKRGRAEVMPQMYCLPQTPDLKLYGMIYALGDVTCFYDKDGKPMPQVARTAIEQGAVVAKNIIADLTNNKRTEYVPRAYPYIVPVGAKYAIAKLGPLVVSGFGGWLFKGLVEVNYLLSIMPFGRAIKTWLKGLSIFIQNDRLG